MIDVNDISDQSVAIASYLDEICGLTSSIETEAKENLFEKDNFPATVNKILVLKNNMSSKIMIVRELVKKYLRTVNIANIALNQFCTMVANKKHEKDSIAPGGNHGVNISKIDTPNAFYYDIAFPAKMNDYWEPDSIEIKPIKIEECGSISTILTDNLVKLSSDMASIIMLIPNINNKFEKDIQSMFIPALSSLEKLMSSPSTINSLANKGTVEDNSQNIIENITGVVKSIFNECQNYKNIINDLNNAISAMEKNADIINEALKLYISMDTLI